jgi:methylenetetrahydrofolate dehydrogenase (NADP+)/methenyltetrahydrofolate cyclohydrolase
MTGLVPATPAISDDNGGHSGIGVGDMPARIIDGKTIAADLCGLVANEVKRLSAEHGVTPGLAVVLVGNNPASMSYVGNKAKMTMQTGMRSFDHRLPETVSQADLLALVGKLNADPAVHGILVQLPLPSQIDARRVLDAIDPGKDVDGFHPVNAGRLASGLPALAPCTPLGCIILAKTVHESLAGTEAVVIGRSNIVGKPLLQLLLAENATVTVTHSRTRDLPAVCRRADLLFAAIGRAELVRGDWIKPGATVIDVGINRVSAADGKSRIVGDVAFAEATAVAGAITPVPGGVGPMTIACLMVNTLRAACARVGLPAPAV